MKSLGVLLTLLIFLTLTTSTSVASTLYDLRVKNIEGKEVPMSSYKGKVLLIVNTASQCGFTPQLQDLETLYKKYKKQGLEVLAFPSNDFKQDPKSNSEILAYAQSQYATSFPFFEKGSVTGPEKQPLYQFLLKEKPGTLFKEVQWNFEKFLVDRNGQVVERWNSMKSPLATEVVQTIEKALATKKK